MTASLAPAPLAPPASAAGGLRSAAGVPLSQGTPRRSGASLAARAAARQAGRRPAIVERVISTSDGVPGASAFQSAL